MTDIDRSAIGRAKFFLNKAAECTASQRNEFEAFTEAAIVFARSAIHRVQSQYGKKNKHPKFQSWWDGLLNNPSLEFLREERDFILKEAPQKTGQYIGAPIPTHAREFYFYRDTSGNPVDPVNELSKHITEAEKAVAVAIEIFSDSMEGPRVG
jgi:hypothetical protein